MAAIGNFIGNAWSLWTPGEVGKGMNIVSGANKVASDILSVLLFRGGEDVINWRLGWAPDIFSPLSMPDTEYWVYNAKQEVWRWVPGLAAPPAIELKEVLDATGLPFPDPENSLTATITFTPAATPDNNILTFGWYAYTGAIWNQDIETFREGVSLNGTPFMGLLTT